jgi:hypothetical protein
MRDPYYGFTIADAQFSELERLGDVQFSDEQKRKLLTLADTWISDLSLRRSARPKDFRMALDEMEAAFLEAEAACEWDQGLKYHLVHWAMETSIEDAKVFPAALAALQMHLRKFREKLVALKNCVPPDPGRARPFDDERRMIFLADIFEDAGGKAVVYAGGYYQRGSTADTPFRRFAQLFYSLLPAEDKREPGGLDDALRDALAVRRAERQRSSP